MSAIFICPQFWGRRWLRQFCGSWFFFGGFSLQENIKFIRFVGRGGAILFFVGASIFLIEARSMTYL